MRTRPDSASNHQIIAIAMFLFCGCLWWTAAPLMQEDFDHMRTALGFDHQPNPAFGAEAEATSQTEWSPSQSKAQLPQPAIVKPVTIRKPAAL